VVFRLLTLEDIEKVYIFSLFTTKTRRSRQYRQTYDVHVVAVLAIHIHVKDYVAKDVKMSKRIVNLRFGPVEA